MKDFIIEFCSEKITLQKKIRIFDGISPRASFRGQFLKFICLEQYFEHALAMELNGDHI